MNVECRTILAFSECSYVYFFPIGILTNYYKIGGLKTMQIYLIILRLEILSEIYEAVINQVSAELCSFWRHQGEAVSFLFPAYSGYLHSLACSPFLKLLESLTSVIISSTSGWLSCLHFNMDPCDHIEYNATHISKIFFAK